MKIKNYTLEARRLVGTNVWIYKLFLVAKCPRCHRKTQTEILDCGEKYLNQKNIGELEGRLTCPWCAGDTELAIKILRKED